MEVTLSAYSIFPEERYPKAASDLMECQVLLNEMATWASKEEFDALYSTRKEEVYESQNESTRTKLKEFTALIDNAETILSKENDPDRRLDVQIERDLADAQKRKLARSLEKRKEAGEIKLLKENGKQAKGNALAELIRMAALAYINNYVMQGHLGEGVVTFEDETFTVESVQN
ncbi:hypothetical protein FUAX_06490 [Fulvitalea axinellae]|uniref:Uncharacterized protein n=1 Tax=Fulvitalea axinellae TaxID=1182444 RepID=A0AAU9CK00_9BACT|nr:hypothetical protein FUAX_06490 [Fulvitalea axinellae]